MSQTHAPRRLRRIVGTLVPLGCALAVAAGLWLGSSKSKDWMRRQALEWVNRRLNGTLSVAAADGSWLFGLRLTDIRVIDPEGRTVVGVEYIESQWSPWELLRYQHVEEIRIGSPRIETWTTSSGVSLQTLGFAGQETSDATPGAATNSTALPLSIDRLAVDGLQVVVDDTTWIQSATLAARLPASPAKVEITARAQLLAEHRLQAQVSVASDFRALTVDARIFDARNSVDLSGTIANLSSEIRFSNVVCAATIETLAPYPVALLGLTPDSAELATEFELKLDGPVDGLVLFARGRASGHLRDLELEKLDYLIEIERKPGEFIGHIETTAKRLRKGPYHFDDLAFGLASETARSGSFHGFSKGGSTVRALAFRGRYALPEDGVRLTFSRLDAAVSDLRLQAPGFEVSAYPRGARAAGPLQLQYPTGRAEGQFALAVALPMGWQTGEASIPTDLSVVQSLRFDMPHVPLVSLGVVGATGHARLSAAMAGAPKALTVDLHLIQAGFKGLGPQIDALLNLRSGSLDSRLQVSAQSEDGAELEASASMDSGFEVLAATPIEEWHGFAARLRTKGFDLKHGPAWIAGFPELSGVLTATVTVAGKLMAPKLSAEARTGPVSYGGVTFQSFSAAAHGDFDDLEGTAELLQRPGHQVRLRSTVRRDRGEAILSIDGLDLEAAHAVLPETVRIADSGRIDGEWRVRWNEGLWTHDGRAQMTIAQLLLPDPVFGLSDVIFDVEGRDRKLTLNASASGDQGTVTATGSLYLEASAANLEAQFGIQGLNVTLQKQRSRIDLHGDVTATLTTSTASAAVALTSGTVRLLDGGGGTLHPTALHPDIGDVPLAQSAPQPVRKLHLSVATESPIAIEARQARTNIDLRFLQSPAGRSGRIVLRGGRLDIGNRPWRIERARATLIAESENDFLLDVVLEHAFADFTVKVTLAGTASSPELGLSSTPVVRSEAELLAIVLGGTPGKSGTGVGANAANVASGAVLGAIRQAVGHDLFLDTIAIDAGADFESASLVLGKWITDALFAGYELELSDNETTTRSSAVLRYVLSPEWSFEGRVRDDADGSVEVLWRRTFK